MAGWLAGSFRKYRPQIIAQATLIMPRIIKEPRHVTDAINHATMGGVRALPSLALACVIPCPKPRFFSGSQSLIARVAVGKVAPSPNPRSKRAQTRAAKPLALPVNSVAAPQMTAEAVNAIRAPQRSLTQPPTILNIRYG